MVACVSSRKYNSGDGETKSIGGTRLNALFEIYNIVIYDSREI
jgi:hypothetical protein